MTVGLISHKYRNQCDRRTRHSRLLTHALALMSLASIVAIEALHDHGCAGEGCIGCLIIGWAYALVFACMGISLVRPLLYVLARVRPAIQAVVHMSEAIALPPLQTTLARRTQTPVTLRVCLLI